MLNLTEKLNKSPTEPGCYLFQNNRGKVLYVGKAKNIKKRVNSYFQKKGLDAKTKDLVDEVTNVEFFVTDNELEALLLESRLIKKHQPKYNMELKGGQRYAWIQVTDEKFPRVVSTRNVKKGEVVFGPYALGSSRKEMIHLANSLFKLRVCRRLPKRACLLYHIKQCSAPCIGKISEQDYKKNIFKVEMLLKGKTKELINSLEKEMKKYSDQLSYEMAKLRRDQILALENITEKQKVELRKKYNQDVVNYLQKPNTIIVQLFNINKGIISGRKEFKVRTPLSKDAEQNITDFLRQYYFTEEIPTEVVLPKKLAEKIMLEKYLSKLAESKVNITVPQKGDKLKLLQLVKKNIEVVQRLGENSLLELQNKLSLPSLPRVIEAFDVSNLGPTDVVGSMVYFKDGKPEKNNYRRFKIKTFTGQSDFDAMKEIIYRRYYKVTKEKSQLPDLIMVDGGKPQLTAALISLRELGLQLPVIALAKKEEEIFALNSQYPVRLSKRSAGLKLLQRIRDEAHRFAINYQRLLRSKRGFD